MKNITECFNDTKSISEYISEQVVDEGLKDIFAAVKNKFKQAYEYLKGLVVKVGSYFVTLDKDGNVEPCISPLTAGQAYKDGKIDKRNTLVVLDKAGSKIVKLNTKLEDAKKLYGSGNSIQYWKQRLNESVESDKTEINEIVEHWTNIVKDQPIDPEVEAAINEVKLHNEDPQAKYNIICDNDMLKNRIKMALKNKKLARLMIWGAPGIGKTAILMNVLEEMRADFPDYRIIVKTLSNETPDNFTLPKYIDVDGQEKATDVPKTWLPVYKPTGDPFYDRELDDKCGNGLLFIDELSRATPQVLNVILPLVNEGIFNGYKLGSGWTIVCASNREEDETSGQSNIGNALANRFAQVYYEPTVKTWRKWADQQNFISPLLLQWLSMPESENMSGSGFYYMDPNETMDDGRITKLMCTPRSWTNAMEELACYSHTGTLEGFTIFDIPTNILKSTLNQYVPAEAVDSFVAFLNVISKIGNFDEAVREVWLNQGKGLKINKKDLNLVTLPLAQLICSAHADKLPTEKEFVSLAEWLVDQNSDQLASYVLDVFKSVFMGMINNENIKNIIFLIQKKLDILRKANDTTKIGAYKDALAPFTSKWVIDLEDVPDYSTGLKIISKKYQEAFKSAIVDGQEALG